MDPFIDHLELDGPDNIVILIQEKSRFAVQNPDAHVCNPARALLADSDQKSRDILHTVNWIQRRGDFASAIGIQRNVFSQHREQSLQISF